MIKQFVYPIGFPTTVIDPTVETLAGNRTWNHVTDGALGRFDCDSSNRDLTLDDAAAAKGAIYQFANEGDAGSLVVKNPGGSIITTLRPRETGMVYSAGSQWVALPRAPKIFVSAEQTGTGSSQNVAHGLGVTPFAVFAGFTELPADLTSGADIAQGTHTSTNTVFTVTSGIKFQVLAFG